MATTGMSSGSSAPGHACDRRAESEIGQTPLRVGSIEEGEKYLVLQVLAVGGVTARGNVVRQNLLLNLTSSGKVMNRDLG
jgi:hypothetical protein